MKHRLTESGWPVDAQRRLESADAGFSRYMVGVYNHMAAGLVLTGVVAYLGAASGLYESIASTPLLWIVVIAPLAPVFLLSFRIERIGLGAARFAFWGYAALVGLSLSSVFLVYTGESIWHVFVISAATFGITSAYGYTTRTDLSRLGPFLFMGLIGILIAMLVNLFLASTVLQFVVSVCGVLLFTALTAYDMQRIRGVYASGEDSDLAGKHAVIGALALYLDFLNIFLMLLRLLGNRRR
ncbi:Inner membrane protein YbhL [Paraburkholderia phenoliruptrix]|uniref:Inner membrane protein YbhL n=1 Tax=Paraburkholderia phenoliruptrix TaxID=252970 RepID=A0A6J4ZP51_9BURK|nr:Bax inhibitor-1/YccA family protein [Paraburkholderia phenoliruptrix]CAB3638642.1 Inner membrane protein YbhL [Paraburkholderia phenoliruptrix]